MEDAAHGLLCCPGTTVMGDGLGGESPGRALQPMPSAKLQWLSQILLAPPGPCSLPALDCFTAFPTD